MPRKFSRLLGIILALYLSQPTGQPRVEYINYHRLFSFIKSEVISMVDLSHKTIKQLFEKQIRDLTIRSVISKEESFDYQFNGGWLR